MFRVELDPVGSGFHAEAGGNLGTVFFVQGDEGLQGVLDVPAPAIKLTHPEFVRNVFLPFWGDLERSVDFNVIH